MADYACIFLFCTNSFIDKLVIFVLQHYTVYIYIIQYSICLIIQYRQYRVVEAGVNVFSIKNGQIRDLNDQVKTLRLYKHI